MRESNRLLQYTSYTRENGTKQTKRSAPRRADGPTGMGNAYCSLCSAASASAATWAIAYSILPVHTAVGTSISTRPPHGQTMLTARRSARCCKHAAWPGYHGVTATAMSIQHIYHAYASPVSSLCSGSVGDKHCEAWFACNLLAVTDLYTVHSAHGPWSGWCLPTPVATRIQQ